MTDMIERVAKAIDDVKLFSRFNDWTSDRVEGLPVEICRYGNGDEDEIVIIARFARDVPEYEALEAEVSKARARAAIEAMREPTEAMASACWPLHHPWGKNAPDPIDRPLSFEDMLSDVTADWQAMIDAVLYQKGE